MSGLQLKITIDGEWATVGLFGEVDMATAPQLLDAILVVHQADGLDVTVDLDGMPFMDSQGVAALVAAHRHLAARGARIRVVNAPADTAHVLRITGIDAYLDQDPKGPVGVTS